MQLFDFLGMGNQNTKKKMKINKVLLSFLYLYIFQYKINDLKILETLNTFLKIF